MTEIAHELGMRHSTLWAQLQMQPKIYGVKIGRGTFYTEKEKAEIIEIFSDSHKLTLTDVARELGIEYTRAWRLVRRSNRGKVVFKRRQYSVEDVAVFRTLLAEEEQNKLENEKIQELFPPDPHTLTLLEVAQLLDVGYFQLWYIANKKTCSNMGKRVSKRRLYSLDDVEQFRSLVSKPE
jgi:hypothetical protein